MKPNIVSYDINKRIKNVEIIKEKKIIKKLRKKA
jgi:hypothetical protein